MFAVVRGVARRGWAGLAPLHTRALAAADSELDAIPEFQHATRLSSTDQPAAAREPLVRALEFLQYAPPATQAAARLRLARLHRNLGQFSAETTQRQALHAVVAPLGDPALSCYAVATAGFALLLHGQLSELRAFVARESTRGTVLPEMTYHLHVLSHLAHLQQGAPFAPADPHDSLTAACTTARAWLSQAGTPDQVAAARRSLGDALVLAANARARDTTEVTAAAALAADAVSLYADTEAAPVSATLSLADDGYATPP